MSKKGFRNFYDNRFYVSIEFDKSKSFSKEDFEIITELSYIHHSSGQGDPIIGLIKNPPTHLGDYAYTFDKLYNSKKFLEDILKLEFVKGAFFGKIKY